MKPTETTEPTDADAQRAWAELADLLQRAEQGDRAVLPRLRAALDADARLWRHYGDLAAHAEAALILLAAGKDLLLAESLQRKLRALNGTQTPSPAQCHIHQVGEVARLTRNSPSAWKGHAQGMAPPSTALGMHPGTENRPRPGRDGLYAIAVTAAGQPDRRPGGKAVGAVVNHDIGGDAEPVPGSGLSGADNALPRPGRTEGAQVRRQLRVLLRAWGRRRAGRGNWPRGVGTS